MATQMPVEQRSAQPVVPAVQEDLLSSHSTTPATARPQHAKIRTESMPAVQAVPVATGPSRTAENATAIALVAVGLAVLAAGALFAGGLCRTRLESTLHRVIDSTYEMRIPMLLPVTLVETAYELLAGKQEVSSFTADRSARK